MILSQPQEVRQKFAEQLELLTIQDIADHLQSGHRTIKAALDGAPVRAATVRKIAKALQVKATDIARFN